MQKFLQSFIIGTLFVGSFCSAFISNHLNAYANSSHAQMMMHEEPMEEGSESMSCCVDHQHELRLISQKDSLNSFDLSNHVIDSSEVHFADTFEKIHSSSLRTNAPPGKSGDYFLESVIRLE